MDNLTLVEKWLAGMIAVGGVVATWTVGRAAKEAKQLAKDEIMTNRIIANEKDIKGLKDSHDQRLADIQSDIHSLRNDMENRVQALWDRTEERHNRLDGKIDRLLERGNK